MKCPECNHEMIPIEVRVINRNNGALLGKSFGWVCVRCKID